MAHARERLEQVGGHIIGGLLNNFDPAKAKYYHRSYNRSYYSYRERPEGEQAVQAVPATPVRREEQRSERSPEEIWHTEDIWR